MYILLAKATFVDWEIRISSGCRMKTKKIEQKLHPFVMGLMFPFFILFQILFLHKSLLIKKLSQIDNVLQRRIVENVENSIDGFFDNDIRLFKAGGAVAHPEF